MDEKTCRFTTCDPLARALQVESGFFLECDVKIVAKSIRDRVALIKWRRERTVPSGNCDTAVKKMQQNLLQVPGARAPPGTVPASTDDDQEVEQHTLICTLPVVAATTCEHLRFACTLNRRRTMGDSVNQRGAAASRQPR